jgi:hypothetical protein
MVIKRRKPTISLTKGKVTIPVKIKLIQVIIHGINQINTRMPKWSIIRTQVTILEITKARPRTKTRAGVRSNQTLAERRNGTTKRTIIKDLRETTVSEEGGQIPLSLIIEVGRTIHEVRDREVSQCSLRQIQVIIRT